jgi:hypothetical protein
MADTKRTIMRSLTSWAWKPELAYKERESMYRSPDANPERSWNC